MITLQFHKYHGIGNDFILIDNRPSSGGMQPLDGKNVRDLARRLCERSFSIGADGLIVVQPSKTAAVKMQILNPDGTEPEMCGNGIRCLARFVWETTPLNERKDVLSIETKSGVKVVTIVAEEGELKSVEVDMGEPIIEPKDEEIQGRLFKRVSMGNPHAIFFVENLDSIDLEKEGRQIETSHLFPEGTNVEFVKINSRKEITVKVWERGAGITLACGTGASAAAVATINKKLAERTVTVHLPGGDLEIEWQDDNRVCMRGPAEKVFSGNIEA